MKKLKILYLANFNNPNSNHVEEDIKNAFEQLGHEVIAIPEKNVGELLKYKADMLLFHKAGVGKYISLEHWVNMLNHVTCKKVMWYFDPINLVPGREQYIETVADYIECGFLVDDTWRRRHKFKNLYSLKEGIGTVYQGKIRDEFKYDVVFAGNVYGEREQLVEMLNYQYGDRFKAFNNVFNQDLADLCVSAKITIAPDFPTNEFYWSSRIYLTLGLGGFLVHPDLYGLREEFEEGRHFAGYKGPKELIQTINYYLEHEKGRQVIQKEGQKRCLEIGTFKYRIEQMLNKVYEE